MLKWLIVIIVIGFCSQIMADKPIDSSKDFDSMAIFHKQDQVIVLINEIRGITGEKLNSIIDSYTSENELKLSSHSGAVTLKCNRILGNPSCTFRFNKTPNTVEIHDTWMHTHIIFKEMMSETSLLMILILFLWVLKIQAVKHFSW